MDSKMAARYVHLSGRDVDEAILRANGIEVKKNRGQEFKMLCPRCNSINDPSGKYCAKCGVPLTIEAIVDVEKRKQITSAVIDILMKDPEFIEFVQRKLKELKA